MHDLLQILRVLVLILGIVSIAVLIAMYLG